MPQASHRMRRAHDISAGSATTAERQPQDQLLSATRPTERLPPENGHEARIRPLPGGAAPLNEFTAVKQPPSITRQGAILRPIAALRTQMAGLASLPRNFSRRTGDEPRIAPLRFKTRSHGRSLQCGQSRETRGDPTLISLDLGGFAGIMRPFCTPVAGGTGPRARTKDSSHGS